MIIVAQRVRGNGAGRVPRRVGQGGDDDSFTFGEDEARVGASLAGAVGGEIAHVPVHAVGDPLLVLGDVRRGFGRREPAESEAQFAGAGFEAGGKISQPLRVKRMERMEQIREYPFESVSSVVN